MTRTALLLSLLTACATQTDSLAPVDVDAWEDAKRLGHSRISELVARGHVELDLGEAADDTTVRADARELLSSMLELEALDFDAGHHLSLTYLGKGDTAPITPGGVHDGEAQPKDPLEGVDAFNPATGNEFRIVFGRDLVEAVGLRDAELGNDLGTPVDRMDEAADAKLAPLPSDIAYSWSNDDDDRTRIYDTNDPVTNRVHRRIVHFSNNCTGTLVGPRHVVTAGHCIYSRARQAWSDDFTLRAGRNGTSSAAQVTIDRDNIPNGQVLWYFTPSQWRATSGSTTGFDYGILVLPGRIGDTVGWMGRVTYGSSALQNAYIYRRGYPMCSATFGGDPRIDSPNPCSWRHLYGNTEDCTVGEFESVDSDGWSRLIHHSCDASAGDSGSPLYVYHNGSASVTAVHFLSECERTADDVACDGDWEDRPLGATRLTPYYRDLIGTFRGLYP
jgi:V8-like Glu-specific endopeptidase